MLRSLVLQRSWIEAHVVKRPPQLPFQPTHSMGRLIEDTLPSSAAMGNRNTDRDGAVTRYESRRLAQPCSQRRQGKPRLQAP